jgi:type II secretory pathway component PulF
VAQRVAHAEKVEAGVGEGDGFSAAFDQLDAGQVCPRHHADAGIDADHPGGIASELDRLARHQSGGGVVENVADESASYPVVLVAGSGLHERIHAVACGKG